MFPGSSEEGEEDEVGLGVVYADNIDEMSDEEDYEAGEEEEEEDGIEEEEGGEGEEEAAQTQEGEPTMPLKREFCILGVHYLISF